MHRLIIQLGMIYDIRHVGYCCAKSFELNLLTTQFTLDNGVQMYVSQYESELKESLIPHRFIKLEVKSRRGQNSAVIHADNWEMPEVLELIDDLKTTV